MTQDIILFMWGAISMACAVAGTFFLRFWRRTGDRLFAVFAIAFWILGAHWVVLFTRQNEVHPLIYTIRLLAFLLIIYGIFDKNRGQRTNTPE